MTENLKKSGYYTTTYKVRLYTNHLENFRLTNQIYNELIKKYYELIFENLEFLKLSNQKCLRELEKITIKNKEGKKPKNYFEQNAPVYLRRASINQAIGQARIYLGLLENFKTKKNIKEPSKASKFNAPTTFYKGMYRNIKEGRIELKLFNGEEWKWFDAKFRNWNIPNDAEILSPTIVIEKNYVMAHIPVKQEIEDVTPIKERMKEKNIRVCGVAFSNSDKFAICVILDSKGKLQKTLFVSGGNEYRHKTQQIINKIKKHRQSNWNYAEKDHKNYWIKLNRISEHYAHDVSRKIVNFCIENNAKVIAIANTEDVSKHFGKKVGKYSPIYLRKRIKEYLKYKAFKQGIIITTVRSNYTASRCYKCRGNIKRKGLKSECENGHETNYFFNTAMNIGIMTLKKFGKEIEI